MKEFADESVSVFTVLLYVQRGNSPFMLNSRTFTRRGTPKAKSGMIWIALTEAFKAANMKGFSNTVVFFVFKWSN